MRFNRLILKNGEQNTQLHKSVNTFFKNDRAASTTKSWSPCHPDKHVLCDKYPILLSQYILNSNYRHYEEIKK